MAAKLIQCWPQGYRSLHLPLAPIPSQRRHAKTHSLARARLAQWSKAAEPEAETATAVVLPSANIDMMSALSAQQGYGTMTLKDALCPRSSDRASARALGIPIPYAGKTELTESIRASCQGCHCICEASGGTWSLTNPWNVLRKPPG